MDFDLNVAYDPTIPDNFVLDLNYPPCEEDGSTPSEGLGQHVEGPNQLEEESQNLEEEVINTGSRIDRRSKNLTNDQRRAVYQMMLRRSVDGKLNKKIPREVGSAFSISMRTVERIWKRAKESPTNDVSIRRRNCGRKKKEFDLEKLRAISKKKRTTVHSTAFSLGVSTSVLSRLMKDGSIIRHSNAIKPFLRDENKRDRLRFCLPMLEESSLPHNPVFKSMYNVVHIDEKWFNLSQKKETYYLLPDEEEPLRTCKSKNFIVKVMFLAAIARPRFDAHGNETFSGKIGIFPFVKREPAKRRSVNRATGTIETKPMNSVTREDIKSFLIEKVLHSIREKWPVEDKTQPIFIQQDNARTHVDPDDYEFCEEVKRDGFDIRLMCQPPNSPDLNVLDLGLFRALQALQHKECATIVDELVTAVLKTYEDFSTIKSNRVFLSLQQCMVEIMKKRGRHDYKMKHINKEKLEKEGKLPIQLNCDVDLVKDVMQFLNLN